MGKLGSRVSRPIKSIPIYIVHERGGGFQLKPKERESKRMGDRTGWEPENEKEESVREREKEKRERRRNGRT